MERGGDVRRRNPEAYCGSRSCQAYGEQTPEAGQAGVCLILICTSLFSWIHLTIIHLIHPYSKRIASVCAL